MIFFFTSLKGVPFSIAPIIKQFRVRYLILRNVKDYSVSIFQRCTII